MHLNAKKMAFLGLLLAFAVIMIVASGLLEFNTLFLLAGASFCVGIAIRECGLRLGFGFLIASMLLSLMVAPNKIYCFTFAAMGFYLFVIEFAWEKRSTAKFNLSQSKLFWVIKYIVFNLMFIPIILFLPKLFYQGNISSVIFIAFLVGGQVVLFLYDYAYHYFQRHIWGKIRTRFRL